MIFKVLFTEQYLAGYISAPFLFFAPLLQMLFQVAANQFIVIKKTWPNMLILLTGAIVNIFINWTLIPVLGIEGASIATLLGYVVSDVVCVIVLCKMKLMVVEKKFIIATFLMIGYFLVWRLFMPDKSIISTGLAILFTVAMGIIYRSDLKKLVGMVKSRKK